MKPARPALACCFGPGWRRTVGKEHAAMIVRTAGTRTPRHDTRRPPGRPGFVRNRSRDAGAGKREDEQNRVRMAARIEAASCL